ncbi:FKBP-type peptidyl-prolyl cis-trans isomerase [Ferruginibacter sp. SUN002]|uniref:FKBP-type peptidyl-prolyl cis-trans isomerase n=1 Tax=Ferruginibacter sp. SUN002 TaxID=2937789 RepID=UPI003D3627BC
MNKFFLGLCVAISGVFAISFTSSGKTVAQTVSGTEVKLPHTDTLLNVADTFAYGLGMNIGNNLKDQGVVTLNFDALKKGMQDVFAANKMTITEQQANDCIQKTLMDLSAKKLAAEKARGKAFLDSNAKRPGVITLASGLQYEVMKKGDSTAVMPRAYDTIVAHYVGMLTDGKEFDNSIVRGQPLVIKANEVIPGWTEIVQKMHIGDKWTVFIPSELGYGDRGAGADIPPGATLVFEMELLGVKPFVLPPPPPAPPKIQKTTKPAPVKPKTKTKVKAKP